VWFSLVVEDRISAEIEEMPQLMEGIRACSDSIHGLVLAFHLSRSADLYYCSPRVVCYVNVAVDLLALSPPSLRIPPSIVLVTALSIPTALSFSLI